MADPQTCRRWREVSKSPWEENKTNRNSFSILCAHIHRDGITKRKKREVARMELSRKGSWTRRKMVQPLIRQRRKSSLGFAGKAAGADPIPAYKRIKQHPSLLPCSSQTVFPPQNLSYGAHWKHRVALAFKDSQGAVANVTKLPSQISPKKTSIAF